MLAALDGGPALLLRGRGLAERLVEPGARGGQKSVERAGLIGHRSGSMRTYVRIASIPQAVSGAAKEMTGKSLAKIDDPAILIERTEAETERAEAKTEQTLHICA